MKLRETSTKLEQLLQIAGTPIWDGDLISESFTDDLHKNHLIDRSQGFSFITSKGIYILTVLGLIKK